MRNTWAAGSAVSAGASCDVRVGSFLSPPSSASTDKQDPVGAASREVGKR
jgi:hypothetical protein